jgi:hypothetical protein
MYLFLTGKKQVKNRAFAHGAMATKIYVKYLSMTGIKQLKSSG